MGVDRELHHACMGTRAHLVLRGAPPALGNQLAARLDDLERRWSRFLPDSELSRLAVAAPDPVVVSPDTALLVHLAVAAHADTGGCFDPSVAVALVAAGYDRDFASLPAPPTTAATGPAPAHPTPGVAGVEVDVGSGLVRLPRGVHLDPGGIGKGLAADLVVAEAVAAGARAALVSVGGDLRVGGDAPDDGWEVAVDHPDAPEVRVNLHAGGLATSAADARRWGHDGRAATHLVDPRTGGAPTGTVRAVSVLAGAAWSAEVASTALLVGLDDGRVAVDGLLADGGALVTRTDGRLERLGPRADAFAMELVR